MRTVSGGRNRTVLVLAGLLMVLAGAWIGSASIGLADRWPEGDSLLPRGDSLAGDIAAQHQAWLLPAGLAACVVAALVGLALALMQVPSHVPQSTLRITGEDDQLLGSVEPAVLERALSASIEDITGVLDASVHVSGTTRDPYLQASVAIAADAEMAWVSQLVREDLAGNIATVLGIHPPRVDLLLRPRTGKASHQSAELEAASTGGASR